MSENPILSFEAVSGTIDAEKGAMYGVSIITKGAVRGWNLLADDTTLDQIKKCAMDFANGVKVKLNHYSGVEGIIGTLKNFRIKGKKLLADFSMMKSHPQFSQVMELCQTMPEDLGFSCSFSGQSEQKNNMLYARCDELYSIDLVDQPAANPGGLFSIPNSRTKANSRNGEQPENLPMNTPTTPAAPAAPATPAPAAAPALETVLLQLSTRLEGIETRLNGLQTTSQPSAPVAAPTAAPEKKLSDMTATELNQLIVTGFAKQFSAVGIQPGAVPASPTAQPAAPAPPAAPPVKNFAVLVGEAMYAGKKQAEAVRECLERYPEQYKDWRLSLKPGPGLAHFTAIAPAKTA